MFAQCCVATTVELFLEIEAQIYRKSLPRNKRKMCVFSFQLCEDCVCLITSVRVNTVKTSAFMKTPQMHAGVLVLL